MNTIGHREQGLRVWKMFLILFIFFLEINKKGKCSSSVFYPKYLGVFFLNKFL